MELNNEKLYEKEISPRLLEIARKCEDAGMSFVAVCEYIPNKHEQTLTLREKTSPSMRLARYGVQCQGNVDLMISALLKDAKKYGHNSIYLSLIEEK